MVELLINLNKILSFIQNNNFLVTNLSSPSKGKFPKLLFGRLLSYLMLFNNSSIELTLNPSTLLLVKKYICRYVKIICLYSIVKSLR